MACDATSLLATAMAAGYAKLSERDLIECIVASACAGGGGGGGGTTFGHYGGLAPNFTPASGTGTAFDIDAERPWYYYNGAWH